MPEAPASLRVLVTGATGFVGRAVLARLLRDGYTVRGAARRAPAVLPDEVEWHTGAQLTPDASWHEALAGVDVVVHCAARAHVMQENASDPLAAFREVNAASTLNLARQAVAAGVKRFVFISSIGVNGAVTAGKAFTANDRPAPHSPYAQSKLEAELALLELAGRSPLELVIIRPPLVIGPGAPGNFERLMDVMVRGVPLPFGAVNNRRSFVALDNLTDLICAVIDNPAAIGKTLLVSDGEDLSTTELLHRVAVALGCKARLIPVPPALLDALLRLMGKQDLSQRLLASLQIDMTQTRELLSWSPPVRLNDALQEAARQFMQQRIVTTRG